MCPARRWSLLPRDPLAKPRGLLRGNAHGTRNRALVPRSGGPDHSPLAVATAWVAGTNPQSDGRGPTGLCRALTSRPLAGGMAGCRTLGMNRMHAADRPHTHVLVLNLGSATIAGAGQRGANPAASRPCVHPVGAHRAALCAAYRHCWSAYQSFVPGTSAVPPIRMRPTRSRGRAVGTDARGADGPPSLLPISPVQRIRFDRGYEPSTTSSRQWDPAAARALPIWASSRWPWASTKKV